MKFRWLFSTNRPTASLSSDGGTHIPSSIPEIRFDDECPIIHARLIPSIIIFTKPSDGFRDSRFHWINFGYFERIFILILIKPSIRCRCVSDRQLVWQAVTQVVYAILPCCLGVALGKKQAPYNRHHKEQQGGAQSVRRSWRHSHFHFRCRRRRPSRDAFD